MSKGGIIGYTLTKGALLRWLLTRHVTGEYAERFNDMFLGQTQEVARKTWGSRIKQDQRDDHRINNYLKNQCQKLFNLDEEASTSPINVSTGQLAFKEV